VCAGTCPGLCISDRSSTSKSTKSGARSHRGPAGTSGRSAVTPRGAGPRLQAPPPRPPSKPGCAPRSTSAARNTPASLEPAPHCPRVPTDSAQATSRRALRRRSLNRGTPPGVCCLTPALRRRPDRREGEPDVILREPSGKPSDGDPCCPRCQLHGMDDHAAATAWHPTALAAGCSPTTLARRPTQLSDARRGRRSQPGTKRQRSS
jgi:hypothetical protein